MKKKKKSKNRKKKLSPEQAFKELHEWGMKYAKKKGLKEEDVVKKIHAGRGIKY